jgi:hypothetical protein
MTRQLIDNINREWKFTAGVCSWGPEDTVTPEREIQLMNDFEAVAFAGMQPDQYNILWVRHSHAGHHELHFVIPRMELSTGKAFNAFPPGWQKHFDPLRDLHNIQNGWTRPDDPERPRFCAPSQADIHEARLIRWGKNPTRNEKEKSREQITEYIKAKMETGAVRDRADVVAALREAGLDINREGQNYITVKDLDSGEKIRLKGGVYGADWKLENSGRTHEGEGRSGTDTDRSDFHRTIADLTEQLAGIIDKRALYNVGRYGTGDYERGHEAEPALQDFEHGLRQAMAVPDGVGNSVLPGNIADGLAVDGTRRATTEQAPERTVSIGTEMPGATGGLADNGRSDGRAPQDFYNAGGQDFGCGNIGEGREPLSGSPAGERERPHNRQSSGNQIDGEITHEQNRTGTHSVGLSGTDGCGSEIGAAEPGRENSEHRNAGDRLRAAVDAAVHIVTEFTTAYRRATEYLAERRQAVEREAERNRRGMSR